MTAQLRRKWVEHLSNMEKLRKSTFKLLSHPDATDEHIKQAREIAQRAQQHHEHIQNLLMKRGYRL